MKLRFGVVVVLFIGLLILANTSIVQAQWDAINTGYAVTTNYHGMDVPLYADDVVATAGTIDPDVVKVEFKWRDPVKTLVFAENVTVSQLVCPSVPPNVPAEVIEWAGENAGVEYWYAQSTIGSDLLDLIGDWGVQVFFRDSGNIQKGTSNAIVAIRASSINTVPEVPLGTIVISIIWFGALGVFILKRRH